MKPIIDETSGELLGEGEDASLDAESDIDELRRLAKGYKAMSETLKGDLSAAEKQSRNDRRNIARLEAELKEQLAEAPEAITVKTLFQAWVRECGRDPKRTKLGDKRKKVILQRLRDGYSAEYIMHAIQGAAHGATVSSSETERIALLRTLRLAMGALAPEVAAGLREEYRKALGSVARYDDIELICRDEVKLESFYARAVRIVGPQPAETMREGEGE